MTAENLTVRRDLRSAFLAQALVLAASAPVLALVWFFGNAGDTALAFGAVCAGAAVVLCLWSLLLSIRAARAGATWRWTAILWALAFFELLAPAFIYLSCYGSRLQTEPLLIVLFICVGGPCLALTEIYVIAVTVITRTWPRRKFWIALLTAAYLPVPLALAPTAMLLFAVLNRGTLASDSTARTVVATIPQSYRDEVDRVLEHGDRFGEIKKWRLYLSYHGRLSHERVMENLYNPAHLQIANYTWFSLDRVRHSEAVQVALDVGTGRLPALAAKESEHSIVALIAANGSQDDIVTVLKRRQMFSPETRTEFLNALQGRVDHLLEAITAHRLCTERDVLLATKATLLNQDVTGGYWISATDAQLLEDEQDVYFDWQLLKDRDLSDRHSWSRLLKNCRQSSNPKLQRLSATALADLLHRETHHIPFADALTPDGKPVPVTLDESEELAQLCIAAEDEVQKLKPVPKK